MHADPFHNLTCLSIARKHRRATSLGADAVAEIMQAAQQSSAPTVVLSTCERFEVYTIPWASWCAGLSALKRSDPVILQGKPAAGHLYRVAAGLDSAIPGEAHILGQVRRAADHADLAGTMSPPLRRLFDHALRLGRKVRRETALGTLCSSYARRAADRVIAHRADGEAGVLILGTGALARECIAHLRAHDPAFGITVLGRHADRTRTLADQLGAGWDLLTAMGDHTPGCDVLIAATASPRVLVTRELAPAASLLIDLGMPANIDPAIPQRIALEHLAADRSACAEHPIEAAVAHAERLIEADLARANRADVRTPVVHA